MGRGPSARRGWQAEGSLFVTSKFDVLIANLMVTSRAAGFCRGKGVDDAADNAAEDKALGELRDVGFLLERLAATEPFATSEISGEPICFFCDAVYPGETGSHAADCVWTAAKELVAEVR